MKKTLCLLLVMTLALANAFCACAAGESRKSLTYDELPEKHRQAYEAEMAYAEANVQNLLPGKGKLFALARGDFNGYTGSKSNNSLKVEYTVSDSFVAVGETVQLTINISCDYPPMTYSIGGVVFDENFNKLGTVSDGDDNPVIDETYKSITSNFKLDFAGYFNFVIVVSDGNGNVVSTTTNTVQVYETEETLFSNMAVDGNLGMMLSLDRASLDVGTVITAAVEMTAATDPVTYKGVWTLKDDDGNVLDAQELTGEVYTQSAIVKVDFEYRPKQAGKLQFVINAADGDGNQVKSNTPVLTVEDGYYFYAKMNRVSAVEIGSSLTATYEIHGHECDSASYYIGWECVDADGNVLASRREVVDSRTGKSTYTPRLGQGVEFYAGAACSHFADDYPASAYLSLVGGLEVDLSLTKTTVAYGSNLGLTYEISGGIDPYQSISIKGYTYDESKDRTYTFLNKTVTEAEGTVTGAPKLGDEVYFVLTLVEADSYTTTWTTQRIPLTGAPEVTDPVLTASVTPVEATQGETITLTYAMTGGSGTINKDEPSASYARWLKEDGTVALEEKITAVSGEMTFVPDEAGSYTGELVLLDGYHQQISWTSDVVTVKASLPGDADENGAVNADDALLVMQYAAGWPVTINRVNADVDDSGSVDLTDALLIFRYAAGEEITLK